MFSLEGSGPGGVRSGCGRRAKWEQGATYMCVCVFWPMKHPETQLFSQLLPGTLVGFIDYLGYVVGSAATGKRNLFVTRPCHSWFLVDGVSGGAAENA